MNNYSATENSVQYLVLQIDSLKERIKELEKHSHAPVNLLPIIELEVQRQIKAAS